MIQKSSVNSPQVPTSKQSPFNITFFEYKLRNIPQSAPEFVAFG